MIDLFTVAPEPGSTDWMDGIRAEEDALNKNKLVIWCSSCNSWFHFEDDPARENIMITHDLVCDCGASKGFIGSTLRSERTWSIYTKPPVKKKRR